MFAQVSWRGARIQSRPKQEEVLIPTGHKSSYHQECQREEKQRRSETLKWHLEKREVEKQEVLMHSRSYISRCAREIKSTLQSTDEVVWGLRSLQIMPPFMLPISWLPWSGGECTAITGVGMQFQFSRSSSPPTLG